MLTSNSVKTPCGLFICTVELHLFIVTCTLQKSKLGLEVCGKSTSLWEVELFIRVWSSADEVHQLCPCVCPSDGHTAICHTLSVGHYTETPSATTDTRSADWHWVWHLLLISALPLCLPLAFHHPRINRVMTREVSGIFFSSSPVMMTHILFI